MKRRTDELEGFKVRINLTEYAASQGYELERRASSRNSAVMRSGAGDKIVIAKGTDGHWIFFAVGDERASGSIIDFIQNREGYSLGHVRKELRLWPGGSTRPVARLPFVDDLNLAKDMARVRARYEGMRAIDGYHLYLETDRRIPASILGDPHFEDRIRIDDRGNAIFPHFNREKGLWCSRAEQGETALVIAETAIDALSYAALKGTEGTRFFSIGGEMNPAQPELVRSAIEKMPQGSRIVLAMDNDDGGRDWSRS